MHKHETFAEGSQPGDQPISVTETPIDPEEIRLNASLQRLQDFDPKSIQDASTRQVITDLLTVLDLEDRSGASDGSTIIDVLTTSFMERVKRVFRHGK